MTDESVPGKKVEYATTYNPSLLEAVARSKQRETLGISEGDTPFRGIDMWNCYDFTWLNSRGKPEVTVVRFQIPCQSTYMIESKYLKLYLLSFCQTNFRSRSEVQTTLESDLSVAAQAPVSAALSAPEHVQQDGLGVLTGQCIDHLDLDVTDYYWNPDFLERVASIVTVRESLYTNLLKTVCPITGQPDFGSILIQYNGRGIDKEGLLKYIISYREHAEFSEQVVERIFMDILNRCQPDRLTVHARYARRGGIDINPYRSMEDSFAADVRLWRQ